MAAVSPVLVGRAAEIAVLGESWALARGGAPAAVLIGGEAGIGKTRLVRHFTADVEAEVLYGGCVDLSGGGLPFGPFTAALRGHAGTPAELLPGDGQADSDTARARLFEEVLTRFADLCARQPVVLVIEDIHWIDRSSLDLLSFLVHNQQAAGALLCLVTYRSDELERAHPLRRSLAAPWRLGPLPADPRDRDIVRAKQLAGRSRPPGTAPRARDAAPDRGGPFMEDHHA